MDLKSSRLTNSAVCGHILNSTTAVPRVIESGSAGGSDIQIDIICEECFQKELPRIQAERIESIPQMYGADCFSCGRSDGIVRNDINIGMPFCDTCRRASSELESRAESTVVQRAVNPDQLTDELFIGPKEASVDKDILKSRGIYQILVCCSHLKEHHKDDEEIKYHRLPMADSLDQNLLHYIPSAMEFIEQGKREGRSTLVHCNAGVSRSGAVAVIWLMKSKGLSFDEALAYAKERRPIITPNTNFVRQITSADISTL